MTNSTKINSARGLLREAASTSDAVFSTSFGAEDMVVLDLIHRHKLRIASFTLDTGRLPEETYRLMQQVEARYGRCVATYFPDASAVQRLVASQGINGFYDGVDQRKACCSVRKTELLERALRGRAAWVTGLRAAQSVTRAALAPREWHAGYQLTKFSPLHDWSDAEVWDYLRVFSVPTNDLHARGYPSIGCAPCTRAISVGEDIRAGRWWWEQPESKECGLHARKPLDIKIREVA